MNSPTDVIELRRQVREIREEIFALLKDFDRRGFSHSALDIALCTVTAAIADCRGSGAPEYLRGLANHLELTRFDTDKKARVQ